METQPASMFLGNANYHGTLAAVRSLGRAGVKVVTVDPSRVCRGSWSRYAGQHLTCPAFENTRAWVEWLLQLHLTGPRPVIYATSDAVSFALARYRDELSARFELYQPALDAIVSILDKGQLLQNAQAIGVDTPTTWFPKTGEEAAKIAKAEGGHFLIKPRSLLAQRTKSKGYVAEAHDGQLKSVFDSYVNDGALASEFAKMYPQSMPPLLQRYYPEADNAVYSLSGFREQSGSGTIMRGAIKVLQHPPLVGVGLCFARAPVYPALADQTVRLCERIGYYGVFELEFIFAGQKAMLIDFNGRFYNQLAFDIARGMDLPTLIYAAASGDQASVACLMTQGNAKQRENVAGYCNRFGLTTRRKMQRMFGRMSSGDARRWRAWSRGSDGKIIDAVQDPDDTLPLLVDVGQLLAQALRHPRAFIRQYGLTQ